MTRLRGVPWDTVVWLAVALLVGLESVRLGVGQPGHPGPGFIMFWTAVVLGGLATALLFGSRAAEPADADGAGPVRIAAAVALLMAYAASLERVGFLLVTPVMVAGMVRLGGETRWPRIAAFSVAATLATYVVLHTWLGVQLPAGVAGMIWMPQ
jgi:hypothetical protein